MKLDAVLRGDGEQLLDFTVWDFHRRRQRHGRRRDAAFLEKSFQSGGGQQYEHPNLLGFDRKRVRDIAWQDDKRPGRSLDCLSAYRSGHLALKDVDGFFFPAVGVLRRHIAFSGDCFDQREPSLSLCTRGEKREQPACVPD